SWSTSPHLGEEVERIVSAQSGSQPSAVKHLNHAAFTLAIRKTEIPRRCLHSLGGALSRALAPEGPASNAALSRRCTRGSSGVRPTQAPRQVHSVAAIALHRS